MWQHEPLLQATRERLRLRSKSLIVPGSWQSRSLSEVEALPMNYCHMQHVPLVSI